VLPSKSKPAVRFAVRLDESFVNRAVLRRLKRVIKNQLCENQFGA